MVAYADARVICREKQYEELQLLLGLEDDNSAVFTPVQAVFVFGDSGTGKSFTVKKLLSAAEARSAQNEVSAGGRIRSAWLNCVELLQSRSVFSSIIDRLTMDEFKSLDDISALTSCDSPSDFIRCFQSLHPDDRVYIVFDNAHRLRELDSHIVPLFLRLQEVTRRVVCCIFISTVLFSHFNTSFGVCAPHEVYFPNYTQDELCRVLLECRPRNHSEEFYENFVQLVLSATKNVTSNVRELTHVASANFSHYIAPLIEDPSLDPNSLKLWRNFEPHLKKAISNLYLREVESSASALPAHSSQNDPIRSSIKVSNNKQLIELPFYSKFLLIASYLASYNPPATDRKFFVKNSGRDRRKPSQFRKDKPNYHLLGPRPFPLNRLLAIFHAIVDGRVQPTTVLLSQISSLVHHRLVTQAASKDPLSAPRYKCAVDLDYIESIARTVKFSVTQYLEDFNM